jgi:hypothetical protein
MLAEVGQWDVLQRYATGSNEPALLLWWGRCCESRDDMEGAVASYKQAGEWVGGWVGTRCCAAPNAGPG